MPAQNRSPGVQLLETPGGDFSAVSAVRFQLLGQVDLTDLHLIENGKSLPVNQTLASVTSCRCNATYINVHLDHLGS